MSTRIGFTGKPFEGASRREFLGRHELYSLVALGLVVPAVFAAPGRGVVGRILGNRVLAYLGLISYGIYLYHYAVVHQVEDWVGHSVGGPVELQMLVNVVLAVLGAAIIASLSYYLVERPALRLKRLVSPPVPAERGEATSSQRHRCQHRERHVGRVAEARHAVADQRGRHRQADRRQQRCERHPAAPQQHRPVDAERHQQQEERRRPRPRAPPRGPRPAAACRTGWNSSNVRPSRASTTSGTRPAWSPA